MLRDPDAPPRGEPPPYPAQKARGGDIVLRTRWQRAVFIAGLAGVFVLALALAIWW
jgi:hypothetical protein